MVSSAIQIISPHQDDAAFSLGSVLLQLSRRGIPVTILNCFTISAYAPLSALSGPVEISLLRHREDIQFAEHLGCGATIIDMDYTDAPLRLGVDADHVCGFEASRDPARGVLGIALQEVLTEGPVILPLGLGGHVDHVLARDEALTSRRGQVIAFYEELPYAFRSEDSELPAREVLVKCGASAAPHLCDSVSAAHKRSLISGYSSQASPDTLDQIASWRDGRERLWMTTEFESMWLTTGLQLD
jgi:LmbE family N-acetylglucosaminyl deacetylase